MTPQLRQAIQLLQYSNVEVATFVERELERNPLLERVKAALAESSSRSTEIARRAQPEPPCAARTTTATAE